MKSVRVGSVSAILVVLIGLLAIVGCSSNSSNPVNSNGGSGNGTHTSHFKSVSISNFAFSPASVTVAAGDTVQWTNNDSAAHTVTSDAGSELESSQLSQGQTYLHVFGGAGTFAYHCSIHPTMHGSVTVQ